MDDLPIALWLGMIPTVRVESKGLWGRLSSPRDSLAVSTALTLHIWTRNSIRKDVISKFKWKT